MGPPVSHQQRQILPCRFCGCCMTSRDVNGRRRRALDLWIAPREAGEPLVCVATTFTFDATFFETECLGRFLQMDTHPSESEAVGYLIEREEKLAASKV